MKTPGSIFYRYLGLPTPEDNLAGYQRSDVTAKVTILEYKSKLKTVTMFDT